MIRLILLTFTWTSLVQAIPFPDNFHYYRPTLAQQLPAHAAFQATQLAVNTSLSAAFGERIDRAFKSSAILAAVNTAGGVVSNNIGRAFDANEMNSITHNPVHVLLIDAPISYQTPLPLAIYPHNLTIFIFPLPYLLSS